MTVCELDSSALDKEKWRDILNTKINLWVPKKMFWISCLAVEISAITE